MSFNSIRDQEQEIKDLIRSVLTLESIVQDQENRIIDIEHKTKILQVHLTKKNLERIKQINKHLK